MRESTGVARWATTAGAVTTSVVSPNNVPPTTLTRTVCKPGEVPSGTVTTIRKRPEASATVVPSRTGSLNRSVASGLAGGNPPPVRVKLSPGAACWRSEATVGPPAMVVEVEVGVGTFVDAEVVDVEVGKVDVDVEGVDVEVVELVVDVEELVVDVGAAVDDVELDVDVELDDEVEVGAVVDVVDDEDVDVVEVDDVDEVDDVELVVEELVVPVGTVLDVLVVLDVVVEEVLDEVVGNDEVVVGSVVLVLVLVLVLVVEVEVEVVEVVEVVDVVEVVEVADVPVMTTWLPSPHPTVTGRLLASPGYRTVQR